MRGECRPQFESPLAAVSAPVVYEYDDADRSVELEDEERHGDREALAAVGSASERVRYGVAAAQGLVHHGLKLRELAAMDGGDRSRQQCLARIPEHGAAGRVCGDEPIVAGIEDERRLAAPLDDPFGRFGGHSWSTPST